MRRSVGIACKGPGAEASAAFDSAAAARGLAAVDLRRCGRADAPSAAGHARVTFQPTGAVSDVVIDTPELVATVTGRCVSEAYRRVKVAPFAGAALTVGKRFVGAGGA
jgi:hypothetical protein